MGFEEGSIIINGYSPAIIGKSSQGKVVYDADKIFKVLVERDGMSLDEAQEFFWANIECLYVGEKSPLFVFRGDRIHGIK